MAIRSSVMFGFALSAWSIAPPVIGHDFWIEPSAYWLDADTPVSLRLYVGQHFKGDALAYIPQHVERFSARDRQQARSLTAIAGDDPAGNLTQLVPGATVVTYHSKPSETHFDDFTKFAAYLNDEGLQRHLPLAQKRHAIKSTIIESFARCAKTIIFRSGGDTVLTDSPIGCPLELVMLTNPYVSDGTSIKLRVWYRGKPLADAPLTAFNKRAPLVKLSTRSDAQGYAVFELPRGNSWLITSVHLIPGGLFSSSDWYSYWASLTFATLP